MNSGERATALQTAESEPGSDSKTKVCITCMALQVCLLEVQPWIVFLFGILLAQQKMQSSFYKNDGNKKNVRSASPFFRD